MTILLLPILLLGCSKNKCEILSKNYRGLDAMPSAQEVIGVYKIVDDNSDFRIRIDEQYYKKRVVITGTPPWCSDTTRNTFQGEWMLVKQGTRHFSQNEFGLMLNFEEQAGLTEAVIGLGQFLLKEYNGQISIILPKRESENECLSYLTTYSTSCDFVTFVKER